MNKNPMEEMPQAGKSPEQNIEGGKNAEINNLKEDLSRMYKMYAVANEEIGRLKEQIKWLANKKGDDVDTQIESAKRITKEYVEKSDKLNKELEK
jgi:phage-related minor tail protein